MCQRLRLHFRINSGDAVVSSSFWFIEKTQIRGCVFHSEQDYQLKHRICFHKGWHPQCWRCNCSIWALSFPVFSHTSLCPENHSNLHTLPWGGYVYTIISFPTSLLVLIHWSSDHCMNVNSLPGYFWKVLGRSFERKIKVFCLRYSTLGISPSRHHEQQCTRLVFFCSAESSSIFSAGFANSSPPVLSCQTYKTKMSNLSFIPWKHQAPGLEHSSHFELKRMDSKWQLCLRGRRTCRRHRAKCGKERTELPCC